MIEALIKYPFLQNALFAALLASVVCGIIGTIIIEKKMVMMSGGIAHTAYGGVGLGYLLGFEPMFGAVGFSVLAALGIGWIKRRGKGNSDVIIALFWSLGMALGILFIGLMPSYPPDMNSYLFGNILSVTRLNVWLMLGITALVTVLILTFYNDVKSYLFDTEFSMINGLNTALLEYGLLVLTALTIVVLIRVAGIILIIALLTAPSAAAGLITRRFGSRIIVSSLLSAAYCVAGLIISFFLDLPAGATIIIISITVYAIMLLIKRLTAKALQKK